MSSFCEYSSFSLHNNNTLNTKILASVRLSDCCLIVFLGMCVSKEMKSPFQPAHCSLTDVSADGPADTTAYPRCPCPSTAHKWDWLQTVTVGTVFCWKWSPCERLGALYAFLVSILLFHCKEHLNGWRRHCNGPAKVAALLEPLVSF